MFLEGWESSWVPQQDDAERLTAVPTVPRGHE
jgi:hypothetical protein